VASVPETYQAKARLTDISLESDPSWSWPELVLNEILFSAMAAEAERLSLLMEPL
jgi:hypothetical protein